MKSQELEKVSHRKFVHVRYAGAVTISGKDNDDAKPYQEKTVKKVRALITK